MSKQETISETLQVVIFTLDDQKISESEKLVNTSNVTKEKSHASMGGNYNSMKKNDSEYFAITIKNVQEIRQIEQITPVPRAHEDVLGIMNLRGSVVPVVNLQKKLMIKGNDLLHQKESRIIVSETGGSLVGLLVGSVESVLTISHSDIENIPDEIIDGKNYTKGIIKKDQQLINLLDVEKILGDSTTKDLK